MDKRVFLGLAIVGLVVPYSQFIPFLLENGVDFQVIAHEISGYRLLSAFAWLDVVITAVVVFFGCC